MLHSAIRRFTTSPAPRATSFQRAFSVIPQQQVPQQQVPPAFLRQLIPSGVLNNSRSFSTTSVNATAGHARTFSKPHEGADAGAWKEGEDSHALNALYGVKKLFLTNPIPLVFVCVGAYRISVSTNEDDERNHKQGSKHVAALRQARRDSLKAYKELYFQREDETNYDKSWLKRKGMAEGSTGIVKTNSYRPGGQEAAPGMKRKRSVGMYDSEGLVDKSRVRPDPKLGAFELGLTADSRWNKQ